MNEKGLNKSEKKRFTQRQSVFKQSTCQQTKLFSKKFTF